MFCDLFTVRIVVCFDLFTVRIAVCFDLQALLPHQFIDTECRPTTCDNRLMKNYIIALINEDMVT